MKAEFRYETHLHTFPASQCARASIRENVEFYKELGYDGIFITNHFLDGNINRDYRALPYEEQIELLFRDFEEAEAIGNEIGIKVFPGVELAYHATDFLVYGLDKAWYIAHPEIMSMKKSEELEFLMSNGALVIQAHPFREPKGEDHIRLYPRYIHGVETINTSRSDKENERAEYYAKSFDLVAIAGSDNHSGRSKALLGGVQFDSPISSVKEFIERILSCDFEIFTQDNPFIENT